MNLLYAIAALGVGSLLLLAGVSAVGAWRTESRFPPVGAFVEVDGASIHHVHVPAASPDLPPLVFIHGASANLNDQMVPLRPLLEGRADMLFFDRPGHGWSGRGDGHDTPQGQARLLAALMDRMNMPRAILVAHSFGGALATAFALAYPQRTAGLVFLSAATHPWPGGETAWYYRLAARPVIGRLFSWTAVYPASLARIGGAATCVFAPNAVPDDYLERAAIPLVTRPSAFRANAIDVAGLYDYAVKTAPDYRRISAPTVVVTGDADTIVYEEIHSAGLARDIPGAEIVWVRNLGHKPDWIAPDLVVAAVEKLAGRPRDLAAVARQVEARIAGDRFGAGCLSPEAPAAELAPS
jgi:pimeloyl-ACP methyl ester carboxylesterase